MSKVDEFFRLKQETIDLTYTDVFDSKFQITGRMHQEPTFHRLTQKDYLELSAWLPKIAYLSSNTSGMQIHFWTDSDVVAINATLMNEVDLSQMSRTGAGGFDCYIGKSISSLQFIDATRFEHHQSSIQYTFFEGIPGKKLVVINFPLYVGVKQCLIGLRTGSKTNKAKSFYQTSPIVLYGTSIAQGGCASRPGLAYGNWLTRALNMEIINFGFSGNAFGEERMAQIVAQIDPVKLFILDYEANAGTNGLLEKTLRLFIQTIRLKHPITPIMVVSRIPYILDTLKESLGKRRSEIRSFQMEVVSEFQKSGDSFIYFVDGLKLLGKDWHEMTSDQIHPNDYGFSRLTQSFKREIKKVLNNR